MGPIFEHRFIDGLGLDEIGAAVIGNVGEQDVVVAALDDVDGVDLHIAQMGDGSACRLEASI